MTPVLQRLRDALRRRRDVVGINRRNVELVYPHNARRDYPLADDKLLTKQLLGAAGVPVPETLAVCDGLFAVPRTVEALCERERFVVKPANGSGGDGILVVGDRVGPGRWTRAGGAPLDAGALRKHLADIVFGAFSKDLDDRAFVERRIEPHPTFGRLWPDGLCDLRVILLDAEPLVAMIRVPTTRSGGRANLHQGGVGIAVDLSDGSTVAAFSEGRPVTTHPETGAELLCMAVPRWPETLSVARHAAVAVPLRYVGVDLVVDRTEGPLVLEINARPGLEIQNVHGRGLARFLAEATR